MEKFEKLNRAQMLKKLAKMRSMPLKTTLSQLTDGFRLAIIKETFKSDYDIEHLFNCDYIEIKSGGVYVCVSKKDCEGFHINLPQSALKWGNDEVERWISERWQEKYAQ